jgi:uncharacterized protein YjgD (DUF1641 family)
MANPIAFTPAPYDPKDGLMRRLEAAPREHAEALLVAYDLLQEAHDQGILDALHGMVHAKDAIVGHVAEGARMQESVDALRNLVAAGKMLGAMEPQTMSCIAAAMNSAGKEEPLSLWGLFRQMTSREGRRGLTVMVGVLTALGGRRARRD